ncbi:MAG: septation protein A [Kiloniellaceae bacterium]
MKRTPPRWLRPAVDHGPLAVFFLVYVKAGLFAATGALMAAAAAACALSLVLTRRVPWLPLVTAAAVGVFGGLTLGLKDDTFIKMKPTIVQGLLSALLLGGLALGRPLLKPLLGAAWSMNEAGWRKLTLRFALFFAASAALNEVVWRTQPTDVWVAFKVFGLVGLTLLFSFAQVPLMTRHHVSGERARDA